MSTNTQPPIQSTTDPVVLMDAFKLSVGRAGLLMSVFTVMGLLLALPAGFILQKDGLSDHRLGGRRLDRHRGDSGSLGRMAC